ARGCAEGSAGGCDLEVGKTGLDHPQRSPTSGAEPPHHQDPEEHDVRAGRHPGRVDAASAHDADEIRRGQHGPPGEDHGQGQRVERVPRPRRAAAKITFIMSNNEYKATKRSSTTEILSISVNTTGSAPAA